MYYVPSLSPMHDMSSPPPSPLTLTPLPLLPMPLPVDRHTSGGQEGDLTGHSPARILHAERTCKARQDRVTRTYEFCHHYRACSLSLSVPSVSRERQSGVRTVLKPDTQPRSKGRGGQHGTSD